MQTNMHMKKMTEGEIFPLFLSFMLPVLGGNLFNSLYNIMDTIVVGRYIGQDALAAVGAGGTLVYIMDGLGRGMITGFGILMAQAFGKGDLKRMKRYIIHSAYLGILFTIMLLFVFIRFNHQMLIAMDTIPDIYNDVRTYQLICYCGLPSQMAFAFAAAICQSFGESKTPVFFNIVSAIVNVTLNVFFVVVVKMDVAGVAIATVIAQTVSAVGCNIMVWKHYKKEPFQKEDFYWSWDICGRLLSIGLPMSLQTSIIHIGNVIMQIALNQYTQVYLAATATIGKISGLMMQVYLAIGTTVSVFVGQNYGAGNVARIRKGIRISNKIAGCYSAFVIIISWLIFKPMILLFVGDNLTDEMLSVCRQFFSAVVWFYPVLGVLEVYRSSVRGMGKGFINMLSSCTEVLGKVVVIYGFGQFFGFDAIRFANPVSWLFTLLPIIPCYIIEMKRISRKYQVS